MCELVDRDAETANDESGDAKALGFLCRVVEYLFQCSDVRLVSHRVSRNVARTSYAFGDLALCPSTWLAIRVMPPAPV